MRDLARAQALRERRILLQLISTNVVRHANQQVDKETEVGMPRRLAEGVSSVWPCLTVEQSEKVLKATLGGGEGTLGEQADALTWLLHADPHVYSATSSWEILGGATISNAGVDTSTQNAFACVIDCVGHDMICSRVYDDMGRVSCEFSSNEKSHWKTKSRLVRSVQHCGR